MFKEGRSEGGISPGLETRAMLLVGCIRQTSFQLRIMVLY